ncbi:hypothetical protein CERSUDRAFT_119445 [Gelatoporia subvermispora B]|uniref:Uncharacterized protein n=1 Tax=Ceriporiopsis subvermispora (strain B) TaxID=914234 RepID=M2QYM8_CERS8|nr:hypothetical protein CERSUDRAFT_119445 [Gelatoporia subvermispora B]
MRGYAEKKRREANEGRAIADAEGTPCKRSQVRHVEFPLHMQPRWQVVQNPHATGALIVPAGRTRYFGSNLVTPPSRSPRARCDPSNMKILSVTGPRPLPWRLTTEKSRAHTRWLYLLYALAVAFARTSPYRSTSPATRLSAYAPSVLRRRTAGGTSRWAC